MPPCSGPTPVAAATLVCGAASQAAEGNLPNVA
jgi:hypothetical protein